MLLNGTFAEEYDISNSVAIYLTDLRLNGQPLGCRVEILQKTKNGFLSKLSNGLRVRILEKTTGSDLIPWFAFDIGTTDLESLKVIVKQVFEGIPVSISNGIDGVVDRASNTVFFNDSAYLYKPMEATSLEDLKHGLLKVKTYIIEFTDFWDTFISSQERRLATMFSHLKGVKWLSAYLYSGDYYIMLQAVINNDKDKLASLIQEELSAYLKRVHANVHIKVSYDHEKLFKIVFC